MTQTEPRTRGDGSSCTYFTKESLKVPTLALLALEYGTFDTIERRDVIDLKCFPERSRHGEDGREGEHIPDEAHCTHEENCQSLEKVYVTLVLHA